MKITYLSVTGWDSAIRALYMSMRNYTPELELKIKAAQSYIDYNNAIDELEAYDKEAKEIGIEVEGLTEHPLFGCNKIENDLTKWWDKQVNSLITWGDKHITLVKFLDISMTVMGLHRGAQDDFDAHAGRFNSRIVRMSTRTKDNTEIIELSDWYKGKILPFHELSSLIELPDFIENDNIVWQKTSLGYINKDYINDKDVRRGHIPLAISSHFTVKCQVMEYCHVVRERNADSPAAPELRDLIEMSIPIITEKVPLITRDYLMNCCIQ